MQYLDPRSPNAASRLAVPAVSALEGKTLAFLNNGWTSMSKIGHLIEAPLRQRFGVSEMRCYDLPRSMAPPAGLLRRVADECQAAIVGMAN